MSKVTLTHNKTEYNLEFDRQTVKTLEAQGFVLDELTTKPATMIPMLFQGAFIKNHRGVKRKVLDDIFENLKDKTGLMGVLMELYAETLSALVDDNEDEGNVTWAKVD